MAACEDNHAPLMASQPAQPRQRRHTPLRTCIACRTSDAKRTLIRLVRTADGRVQVDASGRAPGRGAYLCHAPACWQQALQRRSIQRALRLDALHLDDETMLHAYAHQLEGPMADE